MSPRTIGRAFLAVASLALVTAAPRAWTETIDVDPVQPACDQSIEVLVSGMFPDGCFEITQIDHVQNGSQVGFVVHVVDHVDEWGCPLMLVPYYLHEFFGPFLPGTVQVFNQEIVASDRYTGESASVNVEVTCPPAPGPVGDLRLQLGGGGSQILFTWSDIACAADYRLYGDAQPDGPFQTLHGAVPAGSAGIVTANPLGDHYFLLSSANECGETLH